MALINYFTYILMRFLKFMSIVLFLIHDWPSAIILYIIFREHQNMRIRIIDVPIQVYCVYYKIKISELAIFAI